MRTWSRRPEDWPEMGQCHRCPVHGLFLVSIFLLPVIYKRRRGQTSSTSPRFVFLALTYTSLQPRDGLHKSRAVLVNLLLFNSSSLCYQHPLRICRQQLKPKLKFLSRSTLLLSHLPRLKVHRLEFLFKETTCILRGYLSRDLVSTTLPHNLDHHTSLTRNTINTRKPMHILATPIQFKTEETHAPYNTYHYMPTQRAITL